MSLVDPSHHIFLRLQECVKCSHQESARNIADYLEILTGTTNQLLYNLANEKHFVA